MRFAVPVQKTGKAVGKIPGAEKGKNVYDIEKLWLFSRILHISRF